MVLAASDATIRAAHVVHYAVLAVALVGLAGLLVPGALGRPSAARGRAARDEHDARVRALRAELSGHAGAAEAGTSARSIPRPTHRAGRDRALLAAVLGSIVASAVHAKVCPEHFEESLAFGLFFAASAVLQLAWTLQAMRRPSPTLLTVGAVGNFLVVALWTVTRIEGLPFGLLPEPEAVGPWDLLASAAELVVVVACVLAVRRHPAGLAHPGAAAWSGARA